MLAYFPVPYPDELLYSVVARYAMHTGQDNQKAVIRDVFGSSSAAAVADMPSHIDQLVSLTKVIWRTTPESIISQNTLAPLYLPFLAPEKANAVLKSMRSVKGGDIHTRAGISASSIKQPTYLRFCPKCIEEQIEAYGESYWKRHNQVTGLEFCPEHKIKLINSNIEFHSKSKHLFVPAAIARLKKQAEGVDTNTQLLLVSKHIENLLNGSINIRLTHCQWTLFYRDLLKDCGLMNGSNVDHLAINQIMVRYWKNTSLFAQIPSQHIECSWLVNIFRKHRKSFHPIRHVMVWAGFASELTTDEILSRASNYPRQQTRRKQVLLLPASNEELLDKRGKWLDFIDKNPNVGVKRLRKLKPSGAIYTWLYRHDYEWLMGNVPDKIVQPAKIKVDYEKRDKEILDQLINVKAEFAELSGRPRLSRAFLIHQLARTSSIEKHLKDLPMTRDWLDRESESIEDFQVYRLRNAAAEMAKAGIEIKEWRLIRKAGLKPEKLSALLKAVIDRLVSERNHL